MPFMAESKIMANKYHVHVYKVTEMVEYDLEANSPKLAEDIGVNTADTMDGPYKPADCKHIAVVQTEVVR